MARLKRSETGPAAPPGSARLLSLARDLQRRKGRERRALFVAEGIRSVEEVLRARVTLKGAIVSPQLEEGGRGRSLLEALEHRAPSVARITARELAALADTDSPQGVVAIGEIPAQRLENIDLPERATVLLLDGVQDPGNLGTILRTAAAFGAAAVVALPGTVDLWNPKVVRGAMGAHFQVPVVHCEPEELLHWLDTHHFEIWATASDGEMIPANGVAPRVAIALGNEGAGVGATLRARARRTVALPVERGVDSLNVAVAAGILMYVLRERGSRE